MPPSQVELRALTLWRPWPHAILYGGKRIENRPWKPWRSVIGHYIAIHAGLTYDEAGAAWMETEGLYTPPQENWCPAGCIVGVARVTGYVYEDEESAMFIDAVGPEFDRKQLPWFFGKFGWKLEDVVAFNSPVPAKGAMGLWLVNDDTKDAVREAHREALKKAS